MPGDNVGLTIAAGISSPATIYSLQEARMRAIIEWSADNVPRGNELFSRLEAAIEANANVAVRSAIIPVAEAC